MCFEVLEDVVLDGGLLVSLGKSFSFYFVFFCITCYFRVGCFVFLIGRGLYILILVIGFGIERGLMEGCRICWL